MKLSFSRKLLSIADKFMSSGNGASCRVEGLSNTDKVHLQRRLAERCRHRAEIVTVNYDELFTDNNCEERFEKDRVGLRSGDLICQTISLPKSNRIAILNYSEPPPCVLRV